MFCNQCGKEIAESSKFCMNCGAMVNEGGNSVDDSKVEYVKSFRLNSLLKSTKNIKIIAGIVTILVLCAIAYGSYYITSRYKMKNVVETPMVNADKNEDSNEIPVTNSSKEELKQTDMPAIYEDLKGDWFNNVYIELRVFKDDTYKVVSNKTGNTVTYSYKIVGKQSEVNSVLRPFEECNVYSIYPNGDTQKSAFDDIVTKKMLNDAYILYVYKKNTDTLVQTNLLILEEDRNSFNLFTLNYEDKDMEYQGNFEYTGSRQ